MQRGIETRCTLTITINGSNGMTTDILTQEFVQFAIEAEKNGIEFPIDFDDVWGVGGYSRKDNAVRRVKEYLVEGEDYQFLFSEEPDNHAGLSVQEVGASRSRKRLRLSVEGMEHFLLTASTQAGRDRRKLFIGYRNAYIRSLESLFSAPTADRPNPDTVKDLENKLIQTKDVLNNFPISIDELQLTTQIVNKAQIKAAIVRDLEPIKDYVEMDGKIYVTLSMYHILTMSFRSEAGTDISRLPEILKVQTLEYFRLQEKRRANVRMGKRDKTSPGQIPLAL
jgi:hypothetical protein